MFVDEIAADRGRLLDSDRADAAVRLLLSTPMNAPAFVRPYLEQTQAWLESALTTRSPDLTPHRIQKLRDRCSILALLGKREDAFQRAQQLLDLARAGDNPLLIWDAHFMLSLLHQDAGDLVGAARQCEAALRAGRTLHQDEHHFALFLTFALNDVHWQGSLSATEAVLGEEMTFASAEPREWGRQFAAGNFTKAGACLGVLAIGARIFRNNLVEAQTAGRPRLTTAGIEGLASLALVLDHPEQALFLLSAAKVIMNRSRSEANLWSDFGDRIFRAAVGELSDASRQAIWSIGQSTSSQDAIVEALLVAEEAITVSRNQQKLPSMRTDTLSRHERRLLALMAADFENSAIARMLGVSESTLMRREKRLRQKLLYPPTIKLQDSR